MSFLTSIFEPKVDSNRVKWILFLFTVLLYANTIGHDYALDDKMLITANQFTKKGVSAIWDILTTDSFTGFFGDERELLSGGRYRPMAQITFALEHSLFGQVPWISHLVNVLLYGLTAVLLYIVLLRLLPDRSIGGLPFAFWVALIFAAHPLHTEVVANIKSRDEIFGLLFGLVFWFSSIKYVEEWRVKWIAIGGLSLLIALLSKENAVTFLVMVPLSLLLTYEIKIKDLLPLAASMFVAFVVFFLLRYNAVGLFDVKSSSDLMNNMYLGVDPSVKFATIVYTLGRYISLLFFPLALTHDYYAYHIELQSWSSTGVLLSIFSYVLIIGVMFFAIKRNALLSFWLAFYLMSLFIVSNIVFDIGSPMNERFVYLSSIGFIVAIGYAFNWLQSLVGQKPVLLFTVMVLILFGIRTVDRNNDWKNDLSLMTTDVQTSVRSAKSNMSAGYMLLELGKKTKRPEKELILDSAMKYLNRSVEIYPEYTQSHVLRGITLYEAGKPYEAIDALKDALYTKRTFSDALRNLKRIGNKAILANDFELAFTAYTTLEIFKPHDSDVLIKLGRLQGQYKKDFEKSEIYLTKAIELHPTVALGHLQYGVLLGFQGKTRESISSLKRVLTIDADSKDAFLNLSRAYSILGKEDSAQYYLQKYQVK